jgi:hypothetical protein
MGTLVGTDNIDNYDIHPYRVLVGHEYGGSTVEKRY